MKLIVGLGNPGTKYAGTRHNVGFSVIVGLADKYNIELSEKKHKAIYGRGMIEGEKVILAMPQTFMNLSGESVRELVDYYKCDPSDKCAYCVRFIKNTALNSVANALKVFVPELFPVCVILGNSIEFVNISA